MRNILLAILISSPVSAQVMRQNGGIPSIISPSSASVTGNYFSVGGSTFVVAGGVVTTGGATKLAATSGTVELGKSLTSSDVQLNGGNNWHFGVDPSGNFAMANLSFPADVPFNILQRGNVGIGTTVPATKLHLSSGTITIDGTGAPATGGALCLNASGAMSKCTTAPDASGNCTCP